MSDLLIRRPGLLSGFYPERSDERLGTLDRLMDAALGRLSRVVAGRPLSQGRFLARIRRAGDEMAQLSDPELAARRIDIAQRLQVRGLKRATVIEAFALVREVSGRTLGIRHFDVQLLGGWVMLQGQVAEMATGEGKTLTATLTAAVMALSGTPVHVVTVNDFLAARDADWMGRLYAALGLRVGVILEGMSPEDRRAAYACDITYCTNKQLVFDYLKDRLILDQETRPLHMALEGLWQAQPRQARVMLRGLCFAIVDEADSVLIDEARTPLIIARQGDGSAAEDTYRRAIAVARTLNQPRDFTLTPRDWRVDLTEIGRAHLRRQTRQLGGVWATEAHREDLTRQALAALHLYLRDKHYIVADGKVRIVDEYTGRVMADRSWERGLHQMIEVKEDCEVSVRQETLIRISYQRFFRRYVRLAGMTGTAREVAAELATVYRMRTRTVPTNRPSLRRNLGQNCYADAAAKWRAVAAEVARVHATGRPILIGTQSVAASEHLSALLADRGLTHRVLNARQNEAEAEIIARAGQAGCITVATNMAGRGTDIALDEVSRRTGGLHVIATGRHDARRIDRQLYGRAARQGDPGSHITFAALDDDLLRSAYGHRLDWVARLAGRQGRLPGLVARPLLALAQKSAELRHRSVRYGLLRSDENQEDLLAFSGQGE